MLNQSTMQTINSGDAPQHAIDAWEKPLADFRARRQKYLLYGYLPAAETPESVIPAKRDAAKQ